MKVLNYILVIVGVSTSLWMNEMKYVWMDESDSVFAKEGSLDEVSYVEPWFLGSLDVKSMFPRSHGIGMNDMQNVMCFVEYDKYDDAYYSHGITFLIQIGKCHSLS